MKAKVLMLVFLMSLSMEILGVIFKILHLPGAGLLLGFGGFLVLVSIFLLGIKLLRHPLLKDFWNR